MSSRLSFSSFVLRVALASVIPVLGFLPGCATPTRSSETQLSAKVDPRAQSVTYLCDAEFLTAQAVTDLDLGVDFERAFKERVGPLPSGVRSRSLGVSLLSGVAVWAAKGFVSWISEQIKEHAKDYTAQFGGSGVGKAWSPKGEYVALSVRRWKLQGDSSPQLTHHAVFIMPAVREDLGIYQLEPLYWNVNERAPAKSRSDEFTAVINLRLSGYWSAAGAPQNDTVAEFAWVLNKYKVGQPRLYTTPNRNRTAGVNLAPPSAPFGLPKTDAVLYAAFTVSEVDASNAKKYLDLLADAVGNQADAIGGLVEDQFK